MLIAGELDLVNMLCLGGVSMFWLFILFGILCGSVGGFFGFMWGVMFGKVRRRMGIEEEY